jgi:hypothetical protein
MRAGLVRERAIIETEARKLALSGCYAGWLAIQCVLMEQPGYTQVSRVFANEWTRSELNRLCARSAKSPTYVIDKAANVPARKEKAPPAVMRTGLGGGTGDHRGSGR